MVGTLAKTTYQKERVSIDELKKMVLNVWEIIVPQNFSLSRNIDGKHFSLMVDWSDVDIGYALFSGHPGLGCIIAVQSKKMSSAVSSYLGELKSLAWALSDIQEIVAGAHVTMFTDSESVYHKVTKFSKSDSTQDVGV